MRSLVTVLIGLACLPSAPAAAQPISIDLPPSFVAPVGRFVRPLVATGTTGTQTWTVEGCTLPTGLAIRTDYSESWFPPGTAAALAGVATEPAVRTCTVRVTDSIGGTATATLDLTITRLRIVTQRELPDAAAGEPYSVTISAAGATGSLWFEAAGPLPPGLALNSTTGELSGTLAAGEHDFSIQAHDSGSSDTRPFHIRATSLRLAGPVEFTVTQGVPFTHTFTVEGGTPPYSFYPGCCMVGGLSFDSGTGVLSGTPTGEWSGGFNLRVEDTSGNRVERNINVQVLTNPLIPPMLDFGEFEDVTVGDGVALGMGAQYGTPPYTWSLGSALPDGVSLITDARFPFVWPGHAQITGVTGAVGDVSVELHATDSASPAMTTGRTMAFHISSLWLEGPPAPVFNTAYSHQLRVLGGQMPYTFRIVSGSLPKGLTLDNSGLLHGIPLETGSRDAWVEVTDGSGDHLRKQLPVFVAAGGPQIIYINPSEIGPCYLDSNYNVGFGANGGSGNYTWTLVSGAVPPGTTLDLSGNWPSLNGQCTTAGVHSFTLRATDAADPLSFGVREFTVKVSTLSIQTPWNLPFTNIGSPYSQTLTVGGASGEVSLALKFGSRMPPGLVLDGATISGTPTVAGRHGFSIVATDTGGGYAEVWFVLDVYPTGIYPPISIQVGPRADGGLGRFVQPLVATGGTGTYTWAIEGCTLPSTIAIRPDYREDWWFPPNTSAALAGVAAEAGVYNCTLRASDSGGATTTQPLEIRLHSLVDAMYWELPDGAVNTPYSLKLIATGGAGPLTFAANGTLPPGLSVAADGTLSGTPTQPGEYNFGYSVSDGEFTTGRGVRLYVSPMNITTAIELPNATRGMAYSQTIAVTGGTEPYRFEAGCCMPNGMSLSESGVLSGNPDTPGRWQLMITVRDASNATARRNFAIAVVDNPPTLLSIDPAMLDDAPLGQVMAYSIWASGGKPPYTWISTALPPGMRALTPAEVPPFWMPSYTLVGAPTAAGDHTFSITVADSSTPAQSTTREYTLHVAPLMVNGLSSPTFGVAYGQNVSVLGGPADHTFTLVDGKLPYGMTLSESGVLSGTPQETWGFSPRVRVAGSAGTLTTSVGIHVVTDPPSNLWLNPGGQLGEVGVNEGYGVTFSADGQPGPFVYSLESGTIPPGLTLTGNQLGGTATQEGRYRFSIRAAVDGNPLVFAVRSYDLQVTPIRITTNWQLPYANAGTAYDQTLNATGNTGTINWTVGLHSTLPPGLTLTSGGVLSGTPAYSGAYSFDVVATDSVTGYSRTMRFDLPIYVAGARPPVRIQVGGRFDGGVGPFVQALVATGGTGTYTWAIEGCTLPPTIAVRPDYLEGFGPETSATLAGVVTGAGVYNCTLRATDSLGESVTQPLEIRLHSLLDTTHWELPDGALNTPYSFKVTATGGEGPLTFTADGLPPGLSMATDGTLSGTPTQAGDFNFGYSVTDGAFTTGRGLHLYVSPMNITTPIALPNATSGVAYSQTIAVTGGNPPYRFENGCCMPGGLSLSEGGVLSGTPDGPGWSQLMVTVRDASNATARRNFAIAVVDNPPALLSIDTAVLGDAQLGRLTGYSIAASGGKPPYTWTSTALPPGMRALTPGELPPFWMPSYTLLGAPAAAGDHTFSLTVTDSSTPPQSTTHQYTLHVAPVWVNSFPDATFGAPYSQKLPVLGGPAGHTFTLVEGKFPYGMTLSESGVLSGTPQETWGFGPRVRISGSAGTLTTGIGIQAWTAPPSNLWLNPGSPLWDGGLGEGYGVTFSADGQPGPFVYTLESGTIPPGLTLADNQLFGTPTEVNRYRFSIRASVQGDPSVFVVRSYDLQVTPIRITTNWQLPYANAGTAYNQTLEATGTTNPINWTIGSGSALPPGMTLSTGGVLSGTPAYSGAYSFDIVATDTVTGYSRTIRFDLPIYVAGGSPPVRIEVSSRFEGGIGPFVQPLVATGGTGTYTWAIEGCTLPPTIAIRPDYRENWWFPANTSAALAGVVTGAGVYNCTLRATDSGGATTTQPLEIRLHSLVNTTHWELPDAAVGVPYSFRATATGGEGPLTFTADGLPPGLSMTPDGILSGTPTQAGDLYIDYSVTDGTFSTGRGLHLCISPLNITTAAELPNATNRVAYSQAISVTGGTEPYRFQASCCMPNGISLSESGVLSGTPNGPGRWQFNVTVIDANNATARRDFVLAVVDTPPSLISIDTAVLDDAPLGQIVGYSIWASGGKPPYTWTSNALPPGMRAITPAEVPPSWLQTYTLMGAPTVAGDHTFSVTVTDSSATPQSTTRQYTLHVAPLSVSGMPGPTYGVEYNQKVPVLGGPADHTFTLVDGKFPYGLTLSESGVLSGTPLETWGFGPKVRISGSAGTLTTNVNVHVSTAPPSNLWMNPGSPLWDGAVDEGYYAAFSADGQPGPFVYTLESGSIPPGLTLVGNELSGTPTQAGRYRFSIRATVQDSNPAIFAERSYDLQITPIRITTDWRLPYGNAGTSYNQTLVATGNTGSVNWAIGPYSALPPGMTLSTSGVLSGTPAYSGAWSFDVVATDSATGYTRSIRFDLPVYPAGATPPVRIETGPDLGTWPRNSWEVALTASGGTGVYKWSLESGTLPPGIVIRHDLPTYFGTTASAALSGIPTTADTYNFTLKVTSGTQTASQLFRVKVTRLHIKDSDIPEAFVGVPYDHTLTAVEAAGPLTWSVNSNAPLPPGLQLDPATGRISGTPTTEGTYNPGFSVSDGIDSSGWGYNLDVHSIRITSPSLLPNATQNTAYTFDLAAEGGSGAVTWSRNGGIPQGMSLQPDGTIAGTPSQAGTWYFDVTATDSNHRFHTKSLSLNVVGVPPTLPSITTGADFDDLSLGDTTNIHFHVNGGAAPYTWTVTGAPPGLSLRATGARAELTGRTLDVGAHDTTVSVTDSSTPPITTSRTYRIRVVGMSPDWSTITPHGMRGQPYSASLRTIGGSLGTAPPPPWYTWAIDQSELPAGLTLDPSTGMITGTPLENTNRWVRFRVTDGSGATMRRGWNLDIGAADSTVRIDENYDLGWITRDRPFSRNLWANGAPSYVWSVETGSSLPAGLSLSADGTLSGTPTSTGTFRFLVRAADAANIANYGTRQFVLRVTPLEITSQTGLPYANQDSSYRQTITYTGNTGTVSFSVASGSVLPPGMSLSAAGLLSGTPQSPGRYDFRIVISDPAAGTDRTVNFNIDIYPPGQTPPLHFTIGSNYGPFAAAPFSIALSAAGGDGNYHFSLAPGAPVIQGVRVQDGPPLPQYFWGSAGLLGFITNPGTYETVVRVTDNGGRLADLPIRIVISPLMITAISDIPQAVVGMPYLYQFKAVGGTGGYVWTPNGTLPQGLSLDASGTLSGTPAVSGGQNVNVTVTDSAGNSIGGGSNLNVTPFAIISPSVLTQGMAGTPYTYNLTASTPVTWSRISGSLPSGLTLNSSGVISGTPNGFAYGTFTVRAVDQSGNQVTKQMLLPVSSSPPPPLVFNVGPALGDTPQGNSYWAELNVWGGTPPYTWAAQGPLPSGLELISSCETYSASASPGTACLAGAPTTAGDYTIQVRVTDATGLEISGTFTLHVSKLEMPFWSVPYSWPGMPYGVPFSQALPAVGGSGSYTWTAEAQYMPPGLSLSPTGVLSGTPAATGTFWAPFTVTDGADSYVRWIGIDITSGAAATLNPGGGPDLGAIGQGSSWGYNLNPSGSPLPIPNYVYSVVDALPPGCALLSGISGTGGTPSAGARLSCVPVTAGTYSFTLRVQDDAGNFGVRKYTLRIAAASFITGSGWLADASVNSPYSYNLLASGTSLTWSLAQGATLPAGLTLSNGVISGSPTQAGNYSFNVNLTDASGLTITRSFTIRVSPITITNPAVLPATAITNTPFTYALTATGGGASKTWTLRQGSLPRGITLSSDGVLSGITGQRGAYVFVAQVSDGSSAVERRFTLFARDQYPEVFTYGQLVNDLGDVPRGGSVMNYQLAPSGGTPPYNWSLAAGSSLPAGISLISGAAVPHTMPPHVTLLAGTPSVAGIYEFALTATDSAGRAIQRTFKLRVTTIALVGDSLRNPTYGQPYTQKLTAVGGSGEYTFAAVDSLPPGLTLSTDGVISGTAVNSGPFNFRVRAEDGALSFTRNYSVTIGSGTAQTIDIQTGPSLGEATLGVVRVITLPLSGGAGPYTLSVMSGALPPGMALVYGDTMWPGDNTWYLLGAPGALGEYIFTVRAADSGTTANVGYETLKLTVTPMQVFYAVQPAFVGQPTRLKMMPMGGAPPYTFAVAPDSSLPPGLSLSSSGEVTGTPALAGAFQVKYIVTDDNENSSAVTNTLRIWPVAPAPLAISTGATGIYSTAQAALGSNYLLPLDKTLRSGNPPYTWALEPGSSLPPGIVLVPGGTGTGGYLTGIPSALGTYTYALRVTDAAGQSVAATFQTDVSPIGLTPEVLPNAAVGVPYSAAVTPFGGTPPYTVWLDGDSLPPPGITFANGVFAGTPTLAGRYVIWVLMRDSAGSETYRAYTLWVDTAEAPVPVATASPSALDLTYTQGDPAPVVSIAAGSATTTYTAAVAGIPGATVAPASGAAPGSVTLSLAATPVGRYYGVIEITAPDSPTGATGVRAAVNVVAPPPCSYELSPDSAAIRSSGDSGSFTITAASHCSWTAVPSESWVVLTSPATGTGNGTITYTVGANPGTGERTATVTVNGSAHHVKQFGSTCSYTVTPLTISAIAMGGGANVNVTTSLADCTWTATASAPWLHAGAPGGTGTGSVAVTVDANSGEARSGSLSIAGYTVTVNQSAAACSISLTTGTAEIPAAGGSGSVGVIRSRPECGYSVVEGPSWITLTSSPDPDIVAYTVAPNSSTQARTGSLLIGGQVYRIVQNGVSCSFSITNNNPPFGASGGTGTISIDANASACPWTASSNSSWITISSQASGSGSSAVQFTVGANSAGIARQGTLTVAGQTVTINQNGVTCSYALRSTDGAVPSAGGFSGVGVVAATGCAWAASSTAGWVVLTNSSGSGSGDITFEALPNTSPDPRIASITVQDRTYTLTQAGVPCAYTITPGSATHSASAGAGSFTYTTSAGGCPVAPVSFNDWITVQSAAGGTISYTVAQNPSFGSRTGTIKLGDQTFTITQTAGVCSWNLNVYGAAYPNTGGSGNVLTSASQAGCLAPPVGASPEVILDPLEGPSSGIYTQPYTVPPFNSLVTWIRLLYIDIGGQKFTIKQTSW